MNEVQQLVNMFLDENPVQYVDAQFSSKHGGSEMAEIVLWYEEEDCGGDEQGVEKLSDIETPSLRHGDNKQ